MEETVRKLGGDKGVSPAIQKLISELADAVEKEHGVKAGRTALYWSLMSAVEKAAKDIPLDKPQPPR